MADGGGGPDQGPWTGERPGLAPGRCREDLAVTLNVDPDPVPAAFSSSTGPARAAAELLETALFEAKAVLVGQDRMIERLFVSWLARGHCLLEGPPGVAKTLAARTVATILGGSFRRLQFTPDLVPADLVGTRIYRPSAEAFDVELGPVFANIVLADEINRAPAKVQSALLEVMAEGHVSIGGVTYPVPEPFLVLATQNPIEHEGVYPLPEAQRDRFLLKVLVAHPDARQEAEIVRRMGTAAPEARPVLDLAGMRALQRASDGVFLHDAVVDYAVRLVQATRLPAAHGLPDLAGAIAHGAGPRATLGLCAAGRALALLRGRDYVLPQDVYDVARDVLRHRVLLAYEAIAAGRSPDEVVERVVTTVVAPRIAPSQDGPVLVASAAPPGALGADSA